MGKTGSYWLKSGKFTMIQRLAMVFFGAFGFYLLVRTMDKDHYGVWMLYLSVGNLVHTAREGILKKPLIRYINKIEDTEEIKKLQASSYFIGVVYSLVTSGVLLALSSYLANLWKAPELPWLFVIYIGTNLLVATFTHMVNVQEANFRFTGSMFGNTLKSGLLFGSILYFYLSGDKLDPITLGLCDLGSAFVAMICVYLFGRDLIHYKFRVKRQYANQLFSYGKYTLGTNISGIILRNVDIWMLGYFISPVAVAVYNVAIRVANLFEVPMMAMASILFPQAAKKSDKEGDGAFKELYEKSVTVILLMIIPMVIPVILFSDQIIWLLAGDEYLQAGAVLQITMLYGLIVPFNKQMGVLLDATGKAKFNMFRVLASAGLNVVMNAIFIPLLGLMGAAYATLASMVIMMIYNQIYLNKTYNVELKNLLHYTGYYISTLKAKFLRRSVNGHG